MISLQVIGSTVSGPLGAAVSGRMLTDKEIILSLWVHGVARVSDNSGLCSVVGSGPAHELQIEGPLRGKVRSVLASVL